MGPQISNFPLSKTGKSPSKPPPPPHISNTAVEMMVWVIFAPIAQPHWYQRFTKEYKSMCSQQILWISKVWTVRGVIYHRLVNFTCYSEIRGWLLLCLPALRLTWWPKHTHMKESQQLYSNICRNLWLWSPNRCIFFLESRKHRSSNRRLLWNESVFIGRSDGL